MLEEDARKRMSLASQSRQGVEKVPQLDEKDKSRSAVKAGKMFNVNERYVREVKKLKEAGKTDKIEDIRSGKTTLSDIKREERLEKVQKQIKELKKSNLEKPKGDYDVIVIDPPWKVDHSYSPDHYMGRVANPYPEMTIEQIKNIKIPAKEDCIMWLWTTHSQIWWVPEILNSWGFEYKCILIWNKESMGIGKWLRKQCEFCILAIKGNPIWTATDFRDIISEQKKNHSSKPESFYELINKYCVGRKLDYFARKKREGWDVFGDEIK